MRELIRRRVFQGLVQPQDAERVLNGRYREYRTSYGFGDDPAILSRL